jgi:V-type H+-transporting ATPase subunit E
VHSNDARLEVLLARDAVLQKAYATAAKSLRDVGADKSEEYERMLFDLVLQGLIKMNDTEVLVRCRKEDLDLVHDILPAIPEAYLAATGVPVDLKLDKEKFLPEECGGGIVLLSKGGRILLENTFQSRLDISYQQNLPTIRKMLFQDY